MDLARGAQPSGGAADPQELAGAPNILRVKWNAAGANNGSTWADAFTDLQSALSAAGSNAQLWVAEGTYKPTSGSDRTATFQLLPSVSLYGGFAGTETELSQRNWRAFLTVLSGDLSGNDVGASNTSENVYHVVKGANNAVLDGFVIRGGNANAAEPNYKGAGMLNVSVSPSVANCVFVNNYAIYGSAGLGAAIYNSGCTAVVQNCTFCGNVASGNSGGGGGIYNLNARPTIQNCLFAGNAAVAGGGLFNSSATATVQNCTFAGNTGGGLKNAGASVTALRSDTFYGNTAVSGGAVYNDTGAFLQLRECILWGGVATNGAEVFNSGGLQLVSYCDVQGGWNSARVTNVNAGATEDLGGNLNCDPLFVGGSSGSWTVPATTNNTRGQSVLTDGNAFWMPGEHVGKFLQPNTNQANQYLIVGSAEHTLIIWGDVTTNALSGKTYRIHDYHLKSPAGHWESGWGSWLSDEACSPCVDAGDPASACGNEPTPSGGVLDLGAYGNTLEASRSAAALSGPSLRANPTSLVLRAWAGQGGSNSVAVWNCGSGSIAYTVSPQAEWLAVFPADGVSAGEHDNVSVYVNGAGLAAGIYTSSLVIASADVPNPPCIVPVVLCLSDYGTTRYVNLSNAAPVAPYTNWETAATCIQDAVGCALDGDVVMVADGAYRAGITLVSNTLNRVAILRPITVQSVNGPARTRIEGHSPVGAAAIRCAYLGRNAVLSGFSLTNGCTPSTGNALMQNGGGAWCETNAVLTNCWMVRNSAVLLGGGVYGGIVRQSTVWSNAAYNGGGVANAAIEYCVIASNVAGYGGGGAYGCSNRFSTIAGNRGSYGGGGILGGSADNCVLRGNMACGPMGGGGACSATLRNSLVSGNVSTYGNGPGGVGSCFAQNCTIVGNSAAQTGGGAGGGTLQNCIIYYNTVNGQDNNIGQVGSTVYNCATPKPNGTGNIADEPAFMSMTQPFLLAGSPCINAGSNTYAYGSVDLDGNPRISGGRVDMGCYEYGVTGGTGAVSVVSAVDYSNCVINTPLTFTASLTGRALGYLWDWGDGSATTNRFIVTHAYATSGCYTVVCTVWNNDLAVAVTSQVSVLPGATSYVSLAGSNHWPYASWATAATNIQTAIDAAPVGGTVLVAEGTYSNGICLVNGMRCRIGINKPVTVQAVNADPSRTTIRGQGTVGVSGVRGAYVGSRGRLAGFTISRGCTSNGNTTAACGGGVLCDGTGIVSNCVITACSASYQGGGVYGGSVWSSVIATNNAGNGGGGTAMSAVYNSTVRSNAAPYGGGCYYGSVRSSLLTTNSGMQGGGTYYATVENSTIAGNYASSMGGGVGSGTIRNSIVYYNQSSGSATNYSGSSVSSSCVFPSAGGSNNITTAPQFVNMAAGDFRLPASSPCMNRGTTEPWMLSACDLAGNARVLNGTVDMGAYETPVTARVRVWLQGAYDVGIHAMRTTLADTGLLPLTSPYATARITVSRIPTNVTDWVLLELRDTNDHIVVSQSAFVNRDGYLLAADTGATGIVVGVSATAPMRLVVKHRNHLTAMSSVGIVFTNMLTTYDFTTDAERYAGGPASCVALEEGVWGLVAGDADGDGMLTGVEQTMVMQQEWWFGYLCGDLNLDGWVDWETGGDGWLAASNQGWSTCVTNGAVALSPELNVTPPRTTEMSGASRTFVALGTSNWVSWFLTANGSGATLTSLDATSAVYVAGSATNCVDVLEAWDGNNGFGRAYVNVIGAEEVTRAGKAIIIAGRRSKDDPVWPITDYLANLGYRTLRYRGFSRENIQYLSPLPGRDVDGNGADDDIDLASTLDNASQTFTNWAGDASRLFVYLVDHGYDASGNGQFCLSPTEMLSAGQLDTWLDALQDQTHIDVTVVIDCCYAGSFLNELTYNGTAKRVVIASCADDELSYFVAGGLVSFSDAFFCGVLLGLNEADAFAMARDAMSSYQAAWMDDNQDGVCNAGDGAVAREMLVGPSFLSGKDIPRIGHVLGSQVLNGDTAVTLQASDITSTYPLMRVWCMIVPPGYVPVPGNPVASLPELPLSYDPASGTYRSRYEGFAQEGTYKIIYYAEDLYGGVSLPQESWVSQTGYDERVVLVTGQPRDDAAVWRVMSMAYRTFLARRIAADHIRVLAPETGIDLDGDSADDIAAVATWDEVGTTIGGWANGAQKLTVYMVGQGEGGAFLLGNGEWLEGPDLDYWVDTYQSSSNGLATVVLDFAMAGAFLEALRATGGQDRVLIASTKKNGNSAMSNNGLVSFSWHFLTGIFSGADLMSAYQQARDAIRRQTGKKPQEAQLDDNGDGLSNKTDGQAARSRYIGTAFATGADEPVIGQAMPDTLLAETNALTLWVSEVTSMVGLTNVWCLITPPDAEGAGDLLQVDMVWNADTWRYEAWFDGFTQAGTYVCTFLAADLDGNVSAAVQRDVVLADAFESDDDAGTASTYLGSPQAHNFHRAGDVDWVRVYLVPDYSYDFDLVPISAGLDVQMDLYAAGPDGALEWMEHIDWNGAGEGEHTGIDAPAEGFYYVRVAPYLVEGSTNEWLGSYSLGVSVPSAGSTYALVVLGLDEVTSGALPPDTTVTVSGQGTRTFNGATSVVFSGLTNGSYVVSVATPPNYVPREDPAKPGQVQSLVNAFYANPRQVTIKDGWQMAGFEMIPYLTVTGGVVRDAWTRAFVPGAQLAFTARSGALTNKVVDGNAMLTSYRTPWVSCRSGAYPTGIVLAACNWDLGVTATGYISQTRAGAISNAARGSLLDLGTTYLVPVDANGNGVPDTWEALYFPGGMGARDGDADTDGQNNYQEMLAGTNPKDARSAMAIRELHLDHGMTFVWPVVEGRSYRVCATNTLQAPSPWPPVAGPWEAAPGETNMQWTDSSPATSRFYRIELVVP
jgi:hypothetical protein